MHALWRVRSAGTAARAAILRSANLLIVTLTLLTIINAVPVGRKMWRYQAFAEHSEAWSSGCRGRFSFVVVARAVTPPSWWTELRTAP